MSFPNPKPFPGPSFILGVRSEAIVLLGNEWNGLSLDFTDNTYAMRLSQGAETLLGAGPNSTEVSFGVDFTDNTYAVATISNMLFPINRADQLLFSAPFTAEAGAGIDFTDNSYAVRR